MSKAKWSLLAIFILAMIAGAVGGISSLQKTNESSTPSKPTPTKITTPILIPYGSYTSTMRPFGITLKSTITLNKDKTYKFTSNVGDDSEGTYQVTPNNLLLTETYNAFGVLTYGPTTYSFTWDPKSKRLTLDGRPYNKN